MKKLIKLGISLFSVAILGATTPALIDSPIFGYTVVKADETQKPIKYLIDYLDADTGEEITHEMGVLNPGETINIHKNIDGYEVVTNHSWMPDFNVDYRLMHRTFGFVDGYRYTFLEYKKLTPTPTPEPAPTPTPTPEPAPTPTKPAKDQKDPGKPDKPQLPETGEKGSAAATLLGLLVAGLARLTLRKKSY